jgi:nucleotide-binding universal stress UspA family protein
LLNEDKTMFKNVLICSDGSDNALHATRLAAAVAQPLGATITVLNVFDIATATASYSIAPEAFSYAQMTIEYGQQAQKDILTRTSAVLTEMGVSCRTRGEMGHPVHAIVRIAEEERSDLIVLGSHGMSGIERLLLGSVSDGVAHRAPCPVLVVRGQTTQVHRIVVAFDGSEQSGKAVQAAATLAGPLHGLLAVLNVLESGKPFPGVAPEEFDSVGYSERVHQAVVSRMEWTLKEMGIDYQCHQEQGHPAEAIVQFAETNAADLIAVGSRGLGGYKRLLLGSISDAVLHHAHCPVLIVR